MIDIGKIAWAALFPAPERFEDLLLQEPARQRNLAEHCPVSLAIVNGGADQLVDLEYVASLHYRNLWSGEIHVLEGLGHAPHLHAPDRFNALLDRFLADEADPIGRTA
jgi:pimeloyl-ACP methyl ester carboxylesterase